MKKFVRSFLMASLSLIILIPSASAAKFEAAENLIINEPVLEDSYATGGNVRVDASVVGDVHLAGGTIDVNDNIEGDLIVAGGRITVNGDVQGDVRVFGGQIAIYGNVTEDIVVAGGMVDIGKDVNVGGDVLIGAGVLTFDGNVAGSIEGGAGTVFVNGTVGKDIVLTIEDSIKFAPDASVAGNLRYSALLESTVPEGVVQGEVAFNQFERDLRDFTYFFALHKLLSYLSSLVLVLLLVLLAPKMLVKTGDVIRKNVLKSFGVGVLTVILAGVGSILLMVTVIGIPLGLIGLAGLAILMYVSKLFVAVWIGSYFVNFSKKKKGLKLALFGVMALVLLGYYLLSYIPYVGWIVTMILFLFGAGGVMMVKKEYYVYLKGKKMV